MALKHKLEAVEDAARAATKAARAAAEGEASGKRVAMELAELAREQKVRHVDQCRVSARSPPQGKRVCVGLGVRVKAADIWYYIKYKWTMKHIRP